MAGFRMSTLLLLSCLVASSLSEDYYELLGVARDASTRELRRAFKKIALLKHPDKNPSNPDAHNEFVAINTAFEALKDPETRRIYDRFGEEGLKEQQQQGGDGYQSYQYYQEEFGLYDNDEQITTLTGYDFEHVLAANDRVFVNFYSPGCGHCHDLAPAWRELGTAMRGVMVIAAVNCQESWHICQNVNIQSYPTLLLFKQGRRQAYRKPRTLDALSAFCLDQLPGVSMLPKSAWDKPQSPDTPSARRTRVSDLAASVWGDMSTPYAVVVTCAKDDDCLDTVEVNKLQAMVNDVITVMLVQCKHRPTFCLEHGAVASSVRLYTTRTSSSVIYPVTNDDKHDNDDSAAWFAPNLAQDIADRLLSQLPSPPQASGEQLATMAQAQADGVNAVLFTSLESAASGLEQEVIHALSRMLHKAPEDVAIWMHACSQDCQQQHQVTKLPSFRLYRQDGHEAFSHPDFKPDALVTWLQEGVASRVRSLYPSDFPDAIIHSPGVKVVDLFASWCQPCQGMLPHFRIASSDASMHNVSFGSVDCATFPALCQKLNIHSYPTVVLYPGDGQQPVLFQDDIFDSNAFVNFVTLTLDPAVEVLDEQSFAAALKDKATPWMFDFYAPWCQPCMQLKPAFEKAAHELRGIVKLGLIDCTIHQALCQREGVRSYPAIRLCKPSAPDKPRKCLPYRGQRFTNAIVSAAIQALPSKVAALSSQNFDSKVGGSTVPWLVSFGTEWCGPCQDFKLTFQRLGYALAGHTSNVQLGYVDCDRQQRRCQQLNIPHYPYLLYFAPGSSNPTAMDTQDLDGLMRTVAELANTPQPSHDEL
eukprot:m.160604 g.160604  ORF g.160604 m.160604 type:complete len:815 (+) comp16505_c0_seq8:87-2531(+)